MTETPFKNLSREQLRCLRSVNGPARYLGMEEQTGAPSGDAPPVLLVSPDRYSGAMTDPNVYRLFRYLQWNSDVDVERFCCPGDDFLSYAKKNDVAPWSLGTYREVFRFPVWLVSIPWPGALYRFRNVLEEWRRCTDRSGDPRMIGVVPFPARTLPDLRDTFDLVLDTSGSRGQEGSENNDLVSFLNRKTTPDDTIQNACFSPGSTVPEHRITAPIPFISSDRLDRFCLGRPVRFDHHFRLQSWNLPFSPEISVKEWVQVTDRIVSDTGMEDVSVGMLPVDNHANRGMILPTFARRFASRFRNRAISFSLNNPRPGRTLWQYPDLLEALRNGTLNFCTGNAETWLAETEHRSDFGCWPEVITDDYFDQITVTAGLSTPEDQSLSDHAVKTVDALVERLMPHLDDHHELDIVFQPDLPFPVPEDRSGIVYKGGADRGAGPPAESSWATMLQELRGRNTESRVRLDVQLPDHFEALRNGLTTEVR